MRGASSRIYPVLAGLVLLLVLTLIAAPAFGLALDFLPSLLFLLALIVIVPETALPSEDRVPALVGMAPPGARAPPRSLFS